MEMGLDSGSAFLVLISLIVVKSPITHSSELSISIMIFYSCIIATITRKANIYLFTDHSTYLIKNQYS